MLAVAIIVAIAGSGAGAASGMTDQEAGNDSGGAPSTRVLSDGQRAAVARCNDGSVSANTYFETTCSTRDGIDHWAAPYGKCVDGTVIKLSRRASCKSHDGFKLVLEDDFVPKARKGHIAKCHDGTFTSESRFSKTCSRRAGVWQWLKTYGSCRDGHAIRMSTDATCKGHNGFKGLLASDRVPQQFGDNVALCNDGNYSDNTDFYATCSGGDGIDIWLAKYGECSDGETITMSATASCDSGDFKGLMPADFEPGPHDGDIASCANGRYSSNVTFSATCGGHGGVAEWLAAYGTCVDGTVFAMSTAASCERHGGFAGLMPPDYTPPPATTVPPPTTPPTAPPPTQPPVIDQQGGGDCDPNYSGCVPNVSYDLDCPDINGPVQVLGGDPHGFDGDNDGVGCESG